MRAIPTELAGHLAGSATTLATCWIVRRTDGTVLGFTDHDRTLTVDGVACEPASGFDRSSATRGDGLAVGEEEVTGALTSGRITEADLASGRWDGASVEVHLVNWNTPTERMRLRTGTIGEVTRSDGVFRAEVRGPAHALDQPTGRLFNRTCDAAFGDARCKVPPGAYTVAVTVAVVSGTRIRVNSAGAFAAGWFAKGVMTFTSGALAGRAVPIDAHEVDGTGVWLTPWRALPNAPEVGAALTLVAGCDKRFETCADKFGNTDNFRGFPHIPGRDFVFSYARGDGKDDGGVLF